MDIAIIYEKMKASENDSTFILKPVDVELGKVDEKTGMFKANGGKLPSYNNINQLKEENIFYGNPIKVESFAKQTDFKCGTPDYNYALAEVYYEKYADNLLSASIVDDKVNINHIDLSKITNCIKKEGAAKFVEENKYIAIRYKKERASEVDDSSFIVKPIGVIYGDYDDETKLFKEYDTNNVYDAYDSLDALKSDKEIFFQSVCLVSDLIDIDDVTDEDLENLSQKYFETFRGTYNICKCGKLLTKASFDLANFERAYIEEELTEKDEVINKVVESGLKLLEKELNDDDKQKLFDLYKLLIRFCLVEGKINGITKNDIAYQTYMGCATAFADIETAVVSLGIREELDAMKTNKVTVTNPNKEKVNVASPEKEPEEKPFINDLGKLRFPEQSWDDIYNGITKVVIGQDEHVNTIVSVLYKRMIELKLDEPIPSQFGLLLTGSPGSGKSQILKTFASLVDMPIQFADSTQVTATGYTGMGISSYLEELYYKYDCDLDAIRDAFIFFDEIDKIKANGSSDGADIGGKGAQNTLLKFMDGEDYNLSQQGFDHPNVTINTSRMTTAVAGAFAELLRNELLGLKREIGFHPQNEKPKYSGRLISEKEFNRKYVDKATKILTDKDIINYGMTDQLVGRLIVDVPLDRLNVAGLLRVMNESSKSPLLVQEKIFAAMGVEAIFTYHYKKAAAEEAYANNTGARGINKIVQKTTYGPVAELSRNRGKYKKLVFTKECVKDPSKYKLM